MIKTTNHLAGLLGCTKDDLVRLAEDADKFYYHFTHVTRKNSKIKRRLLTPSKDKLRHLHNKLQSRVFSKVSLLPNIKGGVKNQSSVTNSRVHKGRKFRFQTDITAFFPSVSEPMVISALRRKGFSKQVAKLITQLTMRRSKESIREKSLPQGPPTSPFLANVVLDKIICDILPIIEDRDIIVTVWFDDLTFSSKTDFRDLVPDLITAISNHGFKVNRDKTTYRINSSIITGVVTGMSSLKVTEDFRKRGEKNLSPQQKLGRDCYRDYIYRVDKNLVVG